MLAGSRADEAIDRIRRGRGLSPVNAIDEILHLVERCAIGRDRGG